MDSTFVATWLAHQVDAALPGLDPQARLLLLGALASFIVSCLRWVAVRWDYQKAHVAAWWEAHREAINPLLGAILGFMLTGDWMGLLAGAAGRGLIKAAGSVISYSATQAGVKKARAVIIMAALGFFCLGGVARAGEQTLTLTLDPGLAPEVAVAAPVQASPTFMDRVRAATAVGVGMRSDWTKVESRLSTFLGVQLGFVYGDHLSPRFRLTRDVDKEPRWGAEASLWVVF